MIDIQKLNSSKGARKSDKSALLAVLAGTKEPSEQDKIELLRLAAMCGVAGLYEHYKEDVTKKFSLEQLSEVVEETEPFRGFTVEHIFHTALYS